MNDENKVIKGLKNISKQAALAVMVTLKPIIIAVLIIVTLVVLITGGTKIVKKTAGIENELSKDPKNGPAAIKNFMNSVKIDEDGNIKFNKTYEQLWRQLESSNNKIVDYINSAEDLEKIVNAAVATQYPDTREDVSNPITLKEWNKINKDLKTKDVQGIIRFQRAQSNGNIDWMTYVSPSEFKELINNYNNASSDSEREEAKNIALTHFTLEKKTSYSSGGTSRSNGTGGTLEGNQLEIYKVLSAGGLDDVHIAAILGNIQRECGTNPAAVASAGYRGLIQWSGSRFAGLEEYAASKGTDWTDITTQSEYILKELFEGGAEYWGGYNPSNNRQAFLDATDVHEATKIFLVTTEMGRDYNGESDETVQSWYPSWDQQAGYTAAEEAYQKMMDGTLGGGSSSPSGNLSSLENVVFLGDSILGRLENNLNGEGATVLYQSGCNAEFFLGEEADPGYGGIVNGGYFNWDSYLSNTTPKAFYLILGQNSTGNTSGIKRLVEYIQGRYSNVQIYINSVLPFGSSRGTLNSDVDRMNADLQSYCYGNVHYSDVLSGYKENADSLIDNSDGLAIHPNSSGVEILFQNIKNNLLSGSSSSGDSLSGNGLTSTGGVTGYDIVREAEKYVGVLPYEWGKQSLETGADCSGFVWAILNKLGLYDGERFTTYTLEGFSDRNIGTDLSKAQAGDVIVYDGHTGFYDGEGGLIHASTANAPPSEQTKHSPDAGYREILAIIRFTDNVGTASGSDNSGDSNTYLNQFVVKVANLEGTVISGENGNTNSSYKMKETAIPYRNIINKYDMPFNYLWAMQVIGTDTRFTQELAELVYTSSFVITVFDSETTTTTTRTETWTAERKVEIEVEEPFKDPETGKVRIIKYKKEDIKEEPQTTTITTTKKTIQIMTTLTYADSWCAEMEHNYTFNSSTKTWTPDGSANIELKDSEETAPNFVTLFNKSESARSCVISAPEWLFEILENNKDTENLVDLTKYFINKATKKKMFEVDTKKIFNMFEPEEFTPISGKKGSRSGKFVGNNFEEKVWFALTEQYSEIAAAGAMGNFAEESGFVANVVQGHSGDTSFNENYASQVNSGAISRYDFAHSGPGGGGYGLAQWTWYSRKEGLYDLAQQEGTSIDDENTQIKWLLKEIEAYCSAWQSSGTVEEAAVNFHNEFEKSNDNASQIQERVDAAVRYYNEYHGKERPAGSVGDYPRYYQGDDRWAKDAYGSGTIRGRGCGACALAMAVTGLTGQIVEPPEIVSYLNSQGLNTADEGEGTNSASAIASKYGLTLEVVGKNDKEKIDAALKAGKVCMFSIYSNGIYSGKGHYILVYKHDENGYYVVESGHFYDSDTAYSYEQTIGSSNNNGHINILGN